MASTRRRPPRLSEPGTGEGVVLTVGVEGTKAAIDAAVRGLREQLPVDARVTDVGP